MNPNCLPKSSIPKNVNNRETEHDMQQMTEDQRSEVNRKKHESYHKKRSNLNWLKKPKVTLHILIVLPTIPFHGTLSFAYMCNLFGDVHDW